MVGGASGAVQSFRANRRMIYAESREAVEHARIGFARKWKLRCKTVSASFEEAGDELFTFTAFPISQWKALRTTNALERINEEFRRRTKTQASLPSEEAVLFLLFGLGLSGYMSERVAGGLLIAYFMLAINSYLAAYSLRLFKISQWKMGPTEMRLLLMIGNVFLIYHPRAYHQRYLLYDLGGVIAIIGMAFILLILSIQHTHALYKLERLPKQSREAT